MTLTEEQRGALARAIDYINETDLPVGELDGFDREVLRNMVTTAINYGPDVMKMIELLAAGEHDQWADWAQSILDSEPGLSEGRKAAWPGMIATPYENLSEELKDKDRREVYLRSQAALDYIQQQSAEIERLRASLVEHEEHENQTHAILGAILGTDDTLENVAKRAAASIKELEGMLSIRTEELDIAHSVARSEKEMHEKELAAFARRIKELEDVHKRSGAKYAKIINELRSSVYANIPGLDVGKIGPDAAKPQSWQITEERIGLLEYCLETLLDAPDIEEIPGPGHSIEMLRAMLREAEQ